MDQVTRYRPVRSSRDCTSIPPLRYDYLVLPTGGRLRQEYAFSDHSMGRRANVACRKMDEGRSRSAGRVKVTQDLSVSG
jgi:hypothetical protein